VAGKIMTLGMSGLKVINIDDEEADDLISQYFGVSPIIMQLPSVFALYAPSTISGADLISRCKNRLPGKTYGVNVGNPRSFFSLAKDNYLADYLLKPGRESEIADLCSDLHGSFLRINLGAEVRDNPIIKNSSLQGLFFTGILQEKMRLMESLTRTMSDKILGLEFGQYGAPIATSCNISGHPDGTITEFDKAYNFAVERGVELIVLSGPMTGAGSQPVLEVTDSGVEVHRTGPSLQQKLDMLSNWCTKARIDRDA
jgi:hypothetical protein